MRGRKVRQWGNRKATAGRGCDSHRLHNLTGDDWDEICERFRPVIRKTTGESYIMPCNLIVRDSGQVIGIGFLPGMTNADFERWCKLRDSILEYGWGKKS